jgi:hypothetical protein
MAHSWATLGADGYSLIAAVPNMQANMRGRSDARAARARVTTGLESLWNALLSVLWRFLAGAVPGLLAGYASHLVLDAVTPAGLPLIA